MSTSDTGWTDPATEHYGLLFAVRKSILYHRKREEFLDSLNRIRMLVTAVAGSSAVVFWLADFDKDLGAAAAAVAAVGAALELVYGTARGTRLHYVLALRFSQLEKELVGKGAELSDEDLRRFINVRLDIEADESPTLNVLNVMCHNEQLRAMGRYREQILVAWYQRMLAHCVDVGAHRLEGMGDSSESEEPENSGRASAIG